MIGQEERLQVLNFLLKSFNFCADGQLGFALVGQADGSTRMRTVGKPVLVHDGAWLIQENDLDKRTQIEESFSF